MDCDAYKLCCSLGVFLTLKNASYSKAIQIWLSLSFVKSFPGKETIIISSFSFWAVLKVIA